MARSFDGINDTIDIPDNNKLTPSSVAFTFWLKKNYTTGLRPAYSHRANATSRIDLFIGTSTGVDTTQLAFGDGSTTVTLTANASNFTDWHFYMVAFDGASIYLDVDFSSVAAINATAIPSMTNIAATAFIGSRQINFSSYMNGGMAEFAIWDLTKISLASLRNTIKAWRGVVAYGINPALNVYWPLYGVANTEPDLSGNVINATVSGPILANHAPIGSYRRQKTYRVPRFKGSLNTAGLQVIAGSFVKDIRAATAVQKVRGLDFTTQAVILWSNHATTASTFEDSYAYDMAFGPVGSTMSISVISEANTGTSNCSRNISSTSYVMLAAAASTAPTIGAEGVVTSSDTTSFSINWTTNTTAAWIINYLALGGTSFTNVNASTMQIASLLTGKFTTAGLNFTADAVMFMGVRLANPDGGFQHADFNIGVATSTNAQGAIAIDSEHGRVVMDTWRFASSTLCIAELIPATGSTDTQAAWVSASATDFTVSLSIGPSSTTSLLWMALKGGQYRVGSFSETTGGTGTQIITGLNFTGLGAVFLGTGTDTSTAVQTEAKVSVGATDTANECCIAAHDEDNTGSSVTAILATSTKTIYALTATDVVANSSTKAVADFSSFGATTFNINWATNDNSARTWFYLIFGDAITTAYEPSTSLAGIIYKRKTTFPNWWDRRSLRNKFEQWFLTLPPPEANTPNRTTAPLYRHKPFTPTYLNEVPRRNKFEQWANPIAIPLAGTLRWLNPFKEKYKIKTNKYNIWPPVIRFPAPTGIEGIIYKRKPTLYKPPLKSLFRNKFEQWKKVLETLFQFARPISDISNVGSWEDSTYGNADLALWDELDEIDPDDNITAIRSGNNPKPSDTFEVKFSAVTDPATSTGHILRFRARKENDSNVVFHTARLYQGATLIAETSAFTLSTAYQTFEYTLTSTEADTITNYSDLRLRIIPDTS